MNLEEYHRMHALESTHWWFQGRKTMVDRLLRQYLPAGAQESTRYLDVGCGTGLLLQDLSKQGHAVGLDFSPVALEYCRGRGIQQLTRADACHIPLRDDTFDVVTAMDVIEHIDDDKGILTEFRRILKPGGIAIMTVPAHKGLWSSHDIALHHFRRYEKPEFRALVESVGLTPIKYSYFMTTAYLPAVLIRSARKLLPTKQDHHRSDEYPVPAWLNRTLKKCVDTESAWLTHRNLPVGLTLLCVAVKE